MDGTDPTQAINTAPRKYSFAQFQTADDMKKNATGNLYAMTDVLGGRGYPYIADDMMMYPTGEAGPQIEKPLMKYKSAFTPYVKQKYAFTMTRTSTGGLALTVATTEAVKTFESGVDEPGASNGLYYVQTSADNTLEKEGAPVYERNSFWALGQTSRYIGLLRRAGDPDAPTPTDALASSGVLDDGPGSYYAQAASLIANNIAYVFEYQGNNCPRFMDTIAANGDRGQVVGADRVSLSLPIGPYTRWVRPAVFGAKDEFAKLIGSFAQSVDLVIDPIGGNAIPTEFGQVLAIFEVCLWGVRVCGNPDDDCP
jgi:hypothetical protein